MLNFLQSIDQELFRFINGSLSNPVFDRLMPLLSENPLFYPVLLIVALLLIFKGGTRGRLCAIFLLLVIAIGDGVICKTLKETIARPRPFNLLPEVNLLLGKGGSGSMPSSHAANWFAATVVAAFFYRRSWRFMVPLAFLVSFSRVYNGVHYPGDVLVGALLGASYGAAIILGLDWIWKRVGVRWFPLWWSKMPSLRMAGGTQQLSVETRSASIDQHWLRLGYLFIFILLVVRLIYLAAGKIQLSEDEAYQWLWSKHLALSYFSKPLMIAYLQFFGTSLFGDTELGVRFFSPVIAAAMALLILRFVSREVNARIGFIAILVVTTAPILAVGSTLITVDPPLVLFWTAAMFAGWRAMDLGGQTTSKSDPTASRRSTGLWCLAGLFLGLSFLSKYAAFFQIVCWGIFFVLWKPARVHLRKPGPYLALLIFALCTLPVIIWNAQHDWITAHHVADNAGREDAWKPTFRYALDFLGQQAGLLNPIFFLGMVWAMFAFWRSNERRNPLFLFFFSMGAPVFLGYAMFTAYKRVFPNWIAPAIVPLFLLMIIYWYQRWQRGATWIKPVTISGIALGAVLVVVAHDTNLIGKVAKRLLPPTKEPLARVRAWDITAQTVDAERQKLLTEGKPVFIIGAHYGLVGQISFYLPEAKAAVQGKDPLVYYQSSDKPQNQIFFWPEYRYREHRKGQNAIFVMKLDSKNPIPWPVPANLKSEFRSVEDLGTREIRYRDGRVFRVIQLFACRDLQ